MARYGSASFHTYNHFVKGGSNRNASEQAPCLQSIVITWLDKRHAAIDVWYRSTEWFKKYVADIVFIRDVLLEPFDLSDMDIAVTFHFANVTIHPGYWAVVLPHIADPISEMERIRERDPKFHRLLVKHTAEYICPERGSSIANHEQSLRVQRHALEAIRGPRLRALQEYLRGA
jgi:hypothetical protein